MGDEFGGGFDDCGSDSGASFDEGISEPMDTSADVSSFDDVSDAPAISDLPDIPETSDYTEPANMEESYPSLSEISDQIDNTNSIDELSDIRQSLLDGEYSQEAEAPTDLSELDDIPTEDLSEDTESDDGDVKTLGTYPHGGSSDADEYTKDDFMDDTYRQFTEVYGIPEDSPELAAIMMNEENGWDEIHSETDDTELDSEDIDVLEGELGEDLEDYSEETPGEAIGELSDVESGELSEDNLEETPEETPKETPEETPEEIPEEGEEISDENVDEQEELPKEISEEQEDITEESPEIISKDESDELAENNSEIGEEDSDILEEEAPGETQDCAEDLSEDDVSEADVNEDDVSEAIKSVVDNSVMAAHLPHNGTWENPDNPGNGMFRLDDDYIVKPGGDDSKAITGAELKDKYGIEGVNYKGNDPDFTPFVDKTLGAVDVSHMPTERTGAGGSYDVAIRDIIDRSDGRFKTKSDVLDYMKENGITLHETADRKHILPIPTEINSAFSHTGGISKQQSVEAMGEVWKDKYDGKLSLSRDSMSGTVSTSELQNALDGTKTEYTGKKHELFGK